MNKINQAVRFSYLLFFLAANPVEAMEDSEIQSQLKVCALKADQTDRLACYDSITRNLASLAEANTTVAVAAATAASADVTSTQAAKSDDADPGVPVNSISCQRGHSDEYVFTLDNGEVWRQVGGKTYRLSSCEFAGHIVKDFFGYKIIVDDENLKIRVKRVK